MKIALIDDDKNIYNLIMGYLNQFNQAENLKITLEYFDSGAAFLEYYNHSYDMVLMDIEMPGMNGLEVAKELRRIDSTVVLMFLTNMSQYALKGYEVEAIDFMVKPVSYADFSLKLKKAMRYVVRDKDQKVLLETVEGVVHVNIKDIYYIEVINHYVHFHTSRGVFKIRGVFKQVKEEFLPFQFVQINRSVLVNMKYIEYISKADVMVKDKTLAISRGRYQDVIKTFTKYIGGVK